MREDTSKNSIDTRSRILDAAESLFMEYGFDGTSMRLITGQAGVNLAAINYHFGSKELLFQEVFRRRLTDLNREIAALRRQQLGKACKELAAIAGIDPAAISRLAEVIAPRSPCQPHFSIGQMTVHNHLAAIVQL
jgi:AcrR family transcriptional regulator